MENSYNFGCCFTNNFLKIFTYTKSYKLEDRNLMNYYKMKTCVHLHPNDQNIKTVPEDSYGLS